MFMLSMFFYFASNNYIKTIASYFCFINSNSVKKKSGFGTSICSFSTFPFLSRSNHSFPSGSDDKFVSNLKVNI